MYRLVRESNGETHKDMIKFLSWAFQSAHHFTWRRPINNSTILIKLGAKESHQSIWAEIMHQVEISCTRSAVHCNPKSTSLSSNESLVHAENWRFRFLSFYHSVPEIGGQVNPVKLVGEKNGEDWEWNLKNHTWDEKFREIVPSLVFHFLGSVHPHTFLILLIFSTNLLLLLPNKICILHSY